VSTLLARLAALVKREPAAVGALLSAVLPALVALGVLHADARTIAAVVVSVNAVVGFAVRLAVVPTCKTGTAPATASAEPATAG
jgi:hypothetical protein